MKLLVDGNSAFPEIIDCIDNARFSIHINMFIWRDDTIGNRIAAHLLKAADRGVQITISKDRYGAVLEYCEEGKRSFFHPAPTFTEWAQCVGLEAFYGLGISSHKARRANCLLRKMVSHPRIFISDKKNKYDHSKFYVFDENTVILGGINIEDKETGEDIIGRPYHDYMVKITEPDLVREFIDIVIYAKYESYPHPHFIVNVKEPKGYFDIKENYLKIIRGAKEYLMVFLPYFSYLPEFEEAILDAARLGVKITFVIPAVSNFQDDLNKHAINRLTRLSGGRIKVYLYPGVIHAKLLASENTISLGSANITKKAFKQLDELNIIVKNDDGKFAREVMESINETLLASYPAPQVIPCNSVRARLESIVM